MSLVRTYISKASGTDVTFAQFRVMCNVSRGINTVSQIAEHQGVSCPAISKLVESLVKDKCLARHESSLDRRISQLSLTKVGTKRLSSIRNKASKSFKLNFDNLNSQELEQLTQALSFLESFFERMQEKKI